MELSQCEHAVGWELDLHLTFTHEKYGATQQTEHQIKMPRMKNRNENKQKKDGVIYIYIYMA
jgi:hypothetical protein